MSIQDTYVKNNDRVDFYTWQFDSDTEEWIWEAQSEDFDGFDIRGADDNSNFHVKGLKDKLIDGGDGEDNITVEAGGDRHQVLVYGGNHDDIIKYQQSQKHNEPTEGGYSSGEANLIIYGGDGNDIVQHGSGATHHATIYGGSGDDTLSGSTKNDTIHGGADNDIINGHKGSDTLFGGAGDDVINPGSRGNGDTDSVYGGAGADVFYTGNVASIDASGGTPTDWGEWTAETAANQAFRVTAGLADFSNPFAGAAISMGAGAVQNILSELLDRNDGTSSYPTSDSVVIKDFNVSEDLFIMNSTTGSSKTALLGLADSDSKVTVDVDGDLVASIEMSEVLVDDLMNQLTAGGDAPNIEETVLKKSVARQLEGTAIRVTQLENGVLQVESIAGDELGDAAEQSAKELLADTNFSNGQETIIGGVLGPQILFANDWQDHNGKSVAVGSQYSDYLSVYNFDLYDDAADMSQLQGVLFGMGGDDTFFGGANEDVFVGGDGSDTVSYESYRPATNDTISEQGVNVDLSISGDQNVRRYGSDHYTQDQDKFIEIENLIGSGYNDRLYGDDGENTIEGGAGADLIRGGHGNDTLIDMDWRDSSNGEIDKLYGDEGDDHFIIAAKEGYMDNTFRAFGGAGNDTITFDFSEQPYSYGAVEIADLFDAHDYGYFYDIENHGVILTDFDDRINVGLTYGDDYIDGRGGNDLLKGVGGEDTIFGGDGNDVLYGHSVTLEGNDKDSLYGGRGNDTLYGGGGNDHLYADEGGHDRLYGGTSTSDIDTFVVSEGSSFHTNSSVRIYDYDSNDNLALRIAGLEENDVTVDNSGTHASLVFSTDQDNSYSVIVENADVAFSHQAGIFLYYDWV